MLTAQRITEIIPAVQGLACVAQSLLASPKVEGTDLCRSH
jgi:hypothetical protein